MSMLSLVIVKDKGGVCQSLVGLIRAEPIIVGFFLIIKGMYRICFVESAYHKMGFDVVGDSWIYAE